LAAGNLLLDRVKLGKAYSRNAIVHQGRLDASVQLLSKPYTQRELAQKVRGVLDEAGSRYAGEPA